MTTTTDTQLNYVYCRAWNPARWRAGGEITEEEARRRFASDKDDDWFSVVAFRADDPKQDVPTFVLEVMPHATTIRAKFYEPTRSQSGEYIYRQRDGRMFFGYAFQWYYEDDGQQHRRNQAILIEEFNFKNDGVVERTINDKSDSQIRKVSYADVDLSDHWESIPEFGDWARFGNEKR